MIVLSEPPVDDDLCLFDCRKPFNIQDISSESSIEAFVVAILPWVAGGKQILEAVSRVVRRHHNVIAEGEHAFVWPAGITPGEWTFARTPEDEESIRPVDEISDAELMAFARCHCQSSDPVEDIKHALGFARLKTPAKERIKTALVNLNDDDNPDVA